MHSLILLIFLSLLACNSPSEQDLASKEKPEDAVHTNACDGKVHSITNCMRTRFESWTCMPSNPKSVERVIEICAQENGQKTIAFGGERSCFHKLGKVAQQIGSTLSLSETCSHPEGL